MRRATSRPSGRLLLPLYSKAQPSLTILVGEPVCPRRAAQACKIRFQKADGTWVDAAGYPYVKGKTVVCTPPVGTTGPQTVRMAAHISGSLRTFTYNAQITTT